MPATSSVPTIYRSVDVLALRRKTRIDVHVDSPERAAAMLVERATFRRTDAGGARAAKAIVEPVDGGGARATIVVVAAVGGARASARERCVGSPRATGGQQHVPWRKRTRSGYEVAPISRRG